VIQSQMVHDCLRRAFAPTQGGIVGLTEQLLAVCVGGDLEFERVENRCVCRWTVSGAIQEATVPLPPAAFRTILARIAVLCNERSPNSVTPYGGEGQLALKGPPSAVFNVAFVNTPSKQHMKVRSLGAEALVDVERKQMLEAQTQETARASDSGVGGGNNSAENEAKHSAHEARSIR
jgi:hypothetical protein